MRRALLLAAALAIPLSGVATVAISSEAGAGVTIVCTTLTGSAASTVTLSGCSGGNTGGSSHPVSSAILANGGVVPWVSGATTTFGKPVTTATSAKKCPDPTGSAVKAKSPVTADSGNGIKVPGSAKGKVCIAKSGAVSALGPFKIK
jgi:hypothetical protein